MLPTSILPLSLPLSLSLCPLPFKRANRRHLLALLAPQMDSMDWSESRLSVQRRGLLSVVTCNKKYHFSCSQHWNIWSHGILVKSSLSSNGCCGSLKAPRLLMFCFTKLQSLESAIYFDGLISDLWQDECLLNHWISFLELFSLCWLQPILQGYDEP